MTLKKREDESDNGAVNVVFRLRSGVQLLLHGVAIAQWDEQRAYTKGSAGILSHRNAEVYLNETVILSSSSE